MPSVSGSVGSVPVVPGSIYIVTASVGFVPIVSGSLLSASSYVGYIPIDSIPIGFVVPIVFVGPVGSSSVGFVGCVIQKVSIFWSPLDLRTSVFRFVVFRIPATRHYLHHLTRDTVVHYPLEGRQGSVAWIVEELVAIREIFGIGRRAAHDQETVSGS